MYGLTSMCQIIMKIWSTEIYLDWIGLTKLGLQEKREAKRNITSLKSSLDD